MVRIGLDAQESSRIKENLRGQEASLDELISVD